MHNNIFSWLFSSKQQTVAEQPPLVLEQYPSRDTVTFFEETPLEVWQNVLDENMNYHWHDYVSENGFIFENVKTVLDVGCGWGGPSRDMINKYGVDVVGITNSQQQVDYIGKSFEVILTDANTFKHDRKYDLVTFFESLSHMDDTALINVADNTDRILVADGLSLSGNNIMLDLWTCMYRTRDHYDRLFDSMGFRIKWFNKKLLDNENCKDQAAMWLDNIRKNGYSNISKQIKLLEELCMIMLDDDTERFDNDRSFVCFCTMYAERVK